jgi:hypothetical protein
MKTLKTLLVITIAIFGFGLTTVMAQTTAPNTAGAQVITPITLTADRPLEFGKLAVQAAVSGTLKLSAVDVTNPTPANGVTLITGTARTSAKYTVGGLPSYIYTITVPVDNVVTIASGGNTMHIDEFKFTSVGTPSDAGGTIKADGTDVFYVGATLKVDGGQAVGSYTGSYDVTINYN